MHVHMNSTLNEPQKQQLNNSQYVTVLYLYNKEVTSKISGISECYFILHMHRYM